MPDPAAYMRRALALARRGWGMVHPNPMVGAVVVSDDTVIGEGWHAAYGRPHAEILALDAADTAARGATLYVTLEPCAHHGKTPPCTDAIVAAGIAEVVYAVSDPNPAASGGAERLRAAGIRVVDGVEGRAAQLLNASFFARHASQQSFVALKLAMTLDARIAARPGTRTAITGSAAQQQTHRLRSGFDVILVGINTVLVDDPLLTVRAAPVRVAPARVVLDSDARVPLDSQLITSLDEAPVIIMCADDAPAGAMAALTAAGARVLPVPRSEGGLDLRRVLSILRDTGLHSILVEGGSRVATSLLAARLVRRMHLFVSPHFLGEEGVPAFALEQRPPDRWECSGADRYGNDVMITLDLAERDR